LLVLFFTGCASATKTPRTFTWVEGQLQPEHFHFETAVKPRGSEPGGWRVACIEVPIARKLPPEVYSCRMGVDMPIRTEEDGFMSNALAQRIAASSANIAAKAALSSTTVETPLGLACEGFKKTYSTVLGGAVKGSRVKTECHFKAKPFRVPPPSIPAPKLR
jgi:hypothetical protein